MAKVHPNSYIQLYASETFKNLFSVVWHILTFSKQFPEYRIIHMKVLWCEWSSFSTNNNSDSSYKNYSNEESLELAVIKERCIDWCIWYHALKYDYIRSLLFLIDMQGIIKILPLFNISNGISNIIWVAWWRRSQNKCYWILFTFKF